LAARDLPNGIGGQAVGHVSTRVRFSVTVACHDVRLIVTLNSSRSKNCLPSRSSGSPKTCRYGKRSICRAYSFGSSVPPEFGAVVASRLRSSAMLITPGAFRRNGTVTEFAEVKVVFGGT